MNRLKNGTIQCGSPGSIARELCELQDAFIGVLIALTKARHFPSYETEKWLNDAILLAPVDIRSKAVDILNRTNEASRELDRRNNCCFIKYYSMDNLTKEKDS